MKSVKRAIIICWIMLIVCFIIKLFGGNWFEVICDNKHFIYICNYLDNHQALCYCISLPFYVASTFIILISCCNEPKPNIKQSIVLLVFIVFVWALQFLSMFVKMIAEIVMFVCLPFFIKLIKSGKAEWKSTLKKTWYCGIIGYAISFLFQVISLITKNIGIKVVDDNTLISLITTIDFYIMVALYFLYVKLKNKKGGE